MGLYLFFWSPSVRKNWVFMNPFVLPVLTNYFVSKFLNWTMNYSKIFRPVVHYKQFKRRKRRNKKREENRKKLPVNKVNVQINISKPNSRKSIRFIPKWNLFSFAKFYKIPYSCSRSDLIWIFFIILQKSKSKRQQNKTSNPLF